MILEKAKGHNSQLGLLEDILVGYYTGNVKKMNQVEVCSPAVNAGKIVTLTVSDRIVRFYSGKYSLCSKRAPLCAERLLPFSCFIDSIS